MQLQAFGDNGQSFLYLSGLVRLQDVLLGVLILDFTLTVIAAIALRRPAILLTASFAFKPCQPCALLTAHA